LGSLPGKEEKWKGQQSTQATQEKEKTQEPPGMELIPGKKGRGLGACQKGRSQQQRKEENRGPKRPCPLMF